MRKLIEKNRAILYILIAAIIALGSLAVVVDVNSSKMIHLTPQIIEEEVTNMESAFDIPVLTFTEEEADEILLKFQKEREEAARKEAERQARARELARQAAAAAASTSTEARYSPSYFKRAGVLHWGGWRWTWYSERILPGHGLRIPGRHTDAQGYVRDGDGYLCLASDALRRGTVIDTPLGSKGKVYDCGCGMHTIDVYVGW